LLRVVVYAAGTNALEGWHSSEEAANDNAVMAEMNFIFMKFPVG